MQLPPRSVQPKLPRSDAPRLPDLFRTETSPLVAASVRVGGGGSGTIVHVEDGHALVLTCWHVIDGQTTTIHLNGKSYPAEYLAHDKTNTDLACYVMKFDGAASVPVAEVQPDNGASLIGIGYSDGTPRARFGRYDGERGNGPNEVGVTFQAAGGDSGGGVFANGALVGVINKRRSASAGNVPGPGLVISQPACKRFVGACFPLFRGRLRARLGPGPEMPKVQPTPDIKPPAIGERGPAGKDGVPGVDGLPGAPGKDADIAAINKTIADAIGKIKLPPGPQGQPGTAGKDGRDGANADTSALLAEITTLRNEVSALRAQKMTAELFNIDGTLSQRVQFSATQPLKLRLVENK